MENHKLPNATAVLVLGILSIITCCCYGIGIIFGIIALALASGDSKRYNLQPEIYTNYNNLKIGKVLAIIGIVLSALMIIFAVWIVSVVGLENLGNEELVRERLQEYFGQQ
ncbi:MAG: F0F1-type ATP synthase membrane subunit c/vacuolar-type H+-ATPase subunit K [Flavobacterium sp.]|jgi:F0F1-type ATP synthase membrane subunit c/vacuolar-type H+-ATPase subunit K